MHCICLCASVCVCGWFLLSLSDVHILWSLLDVILLVEINVVGIFLTGEIFGTKNGRHHSTLKPQLSIANWIISHVHHIWVTQSVSPLFSENRWYLFYPFQPFYRQHTKLVYHLPKKIVRMFLWSSFEIPGSHDYDSDSACFFLFLGVCVCLCVCVCVCECVYRSVSESVSMMVRVRWNLFLVHFHIVDRKISEVVRSLSFKACKCRRSHTPHHFHYLYVLTWGSEHANMFFVSYSILVRPAT